MQTNLAVASDSGDSCSVNCEKDLETCRKDGKAVIDAAKKALNAKDDVINEQTHTINDLQSILTDTRLDLNNANDSLSKWYHNPVVTVLIGLAAGSLLVVYLDRR